MFNVVTAHDSVSEFALKEAILLYRGRQSRYDSNAASIVFAAIHPAVEHEQGGLRLGAGKPLAREALRKALQGLDPDANRPISLLNDRILFQRHRLTVWYSPPQVRRLFFSLYADRNGKAPKGFPSAATMPLPSLLWGYSGKTWWVFALKGSDRPTLDTELGMAPFFNVNDSGVICIGSTRLPTTEPAANPNVWEDAFFASAFTGPNVPKVFASAKPDLQVMQELFDQPAFPEEILRFGETTVGSWLKPRVRQ
jgi:PRTRC genetic system protein B